MRTTFQKATDASLLLMAIACLVFAQARAAAEAETAPEALAVVLDQKIFASEKEQLSGIILSRLLERFEKDHQVVLTDEDLDAFLLGSERTQKRLAIEREANRLRLIDELKSTTLSDRERTAKEEHLKNLEIIRKAQPKQDDQTPEQLELERQGKRSMARQFVRSWKINQALHVKYGGRVIFQQAGPEPLDAYRDFLKEQEKAGAFVIYDEGAAKSFWNYFVNESLHVFVSEEEGRKMMNTPWWLSDKAAK